MKQYHIRFDQAALDDLSSIKTDLDATFNDPYSTNNVIHTILTKIESLQYFPKRAAVRLTVSNTDLRFTKAGKYTVIYHVNDEKVVIYIYGIFHSRRDIVKILKSRHQS